MNSKLGHALDRFEKICQNWPASQGKMRRRAPFAYVWQPPKASFQSSSSKPLLLTLQAITHGDEVGGIEVVAQLLELLAAGLIKVEQPLAFVLGNVDAARAERRFLEADLNRSFGHTRSEHLEDRRAKQLEPLLEESLFYLDLHQTIEPTLCPFFIFPYAPNSYAFASALHRELPIVTHWGKPFSHDGMCSDEFVNFRGGTGITLELGQKGFDPYHAGVGLQVALAAIQYALRHAEGQGQRPTTRDQAKIFTWKAIVSYEKGMELREGLVNFQGLRLGEIIGHAGGRELLVPCDGPLLFPKYARDPLASPPKEIYRIMKEINPAELGQEGVMLR